MEKYDADEFNFQFLLWRNIPYEVFSKQLRRVIALRFVKETQNEMKAFLPDRSSDLLLLTEILKQILKESDYLDTHAAQLMKVLPMIYQEKNILSQESPTDVLSKKERYRVTTEAKSKSHPNEPLENIPDRVLDDMLGYWSYLHCCKEYLARVRGMLRRSDVSYKVGKQLEDLAWENGEDKLDKSGIHKKMETDYQTYQNQLKYDALFSGKAIKPRTVLMNRIYQDIEIFPSLSALLALDALTMAVTNEKKDKEKLLQFKKTMAEKDEKYSVHSFVKASRVLYRSICADLQAEFQDVYHPVKYPRAKTLAEKYSFEYADWGITQDHLVSEKNSLFREHIPFALPVCRVRVLATQIVLCCGLDLENLTQLIKTLPKQLYGFKSSKAAAECNEVKQTEVKNIIGVFRELASPEYYHCKLGETAFLEKCRATIKKLKGYGFIDKELKTNLQIAKFLRKYFIYVDISEFMLFACAPVSMLSDYPKLETPFLSNLRDNMQEKLDGLKDVFQKNLSTPTDKTVQPLPTTTIKNALDKMTLRQAIAFFEKVLSEETPTRELIGAAVKRQIIETESKLPKGFADIEEGDQKFLEIFPKFWDKAAKLVSKAGLNVLFRASLFSYHLIESNDLKKDGRL